MFIGGVVLVIGIQNTVMFFWKRFRGAACLLGGMFIVLIGYPIIGMCIEIFGIINLFGYVLFLGVIAVALVIDRFILQEFFPNDL